MLDSRFAVVVASSALVVGGFVAVLSAVDHRAALARAHREHADAVAGADDPVGTSGPAARADATHHVRVGDRQPGATVLLHAGPDPLAVQRPGAEAPGLRPTVRAGGAARWITNVVTSSDFEAVGRVRWVSQGVAYFAVAHRFSCAHPDQNRRVREERVLRYWREGDHLYVGVDDEAELLPLPSVERSGEPRRWMVFRKVTAATLWARYLLRLCQPTADSACDDACFDPVGAP